ncbi:hypothetical protein AB685_02065 [Bacillus sp. LL01]|uniref:hypothetical protein n=1 Tax=Bacillus sp. LL01 TaxID=1665556 RepID=UPI00064D2235|nr:hypothetical protein [Bacillus sp. LL01]KMJ59679.1 hypothetical protein AB685_02065 [Bacillus sp. LL01]
MFDPTVFDNLKVVIEGDLYDLDLVGQIQIADRKDRIDLATMSRSFSMKFTLDDKVFGEISLSSDIENISGELLRLNEKPGCRVKLVFMKIAHPEADIDAEVLKWRIFLSDIWEEREITIFSTRKHDAEEEVTLSAEINFTRLIHEENIDDLRDMLTFMIQSLN